MTSIRSLQGLLQNRDTS